MSGPIDIVVCIHNAFRRDTLEIDDAAFKAGGVVGISLAFWIDCTLPEKFWAITRRARKRRCSLLSTR